MYDFDENLYCDCAECGGVAVIGNKVSLESIPPQYEYRCPSCDHRGYVRCDMAYYIGVKKDNTEFYKELQAEQQEQM